MQSDAYQSNWGVTSSISLSQSLYRITELLSYIWIPKRIDRECITKDYGMDHRFLNISPLELNNDGGTFFGVLCFLLVAHVFFFIAMLYICRTDLQVFPVSRNTLSRVCVKPVDSLVKSSREPIEHSLERSRSSYLTHNAYWLTSDSIL